ETAESLSAPHVSRLTFHVYQARSQPDSPDVPARHPQSRRGDQYPTTSQRYRVPYRPTTPCSSRVSPPRSALIQSHARHRGCSIEMPARHISRPHANAPRSDHIKMRRQEREPTHARPVRRGTLPGIPSHVPSARNDSTQESDQGHRVAEIPHSLPSGANCRTTDYSVTPTPTPLLSSRPIARGRTRRIGKESERSQAESEPIHADTLNRKTVRPVLRPA